MAGRGRGRANTLPAWMTKQGINAPPPAGPSPGSRPPPCAGAGPPPPPRNGQFDDAPEPAPCPPMVRNDVREPPETHRRYESGLVHEAEALDTTVIATTESTDVGKRHTDVVTSRGASREPSRERSRFRERRDHRGDSRRGGGDRYEDRGYSARGPRNDDYRRTDGRPLRRDDEAVERGYRRPSSNGHDDRTFRRYAADYQP
ncbi:unnamed protein product [Peronospora destructor]|uniref:Uncharacterized protein n=1 Tax=Peronospora destructor TaxID=86335 RepID=A0AAV0TMK4_9STRA|nr:unnamed protein product [Peronospora destructor]